MSGADGSTDSIVEVKDDEQPILKDKAVGFDKFNPFLKQNDPSLHVNWVSLQQIYPNLSVYGGPTCLLPVQSYYILGTAKGIVLIFNKNQFIQSTLSPDLADFRSGVSSLDVNQDGTHVCASYESGDIFLWDLNSVQPEEGNQNHLLSILHISTHRGHTVNGLGFIPGKHTSIVSSDSTGQIFFHKGTRNHLWELTPNSKCLMRLNPMTNPLLMTKISNSENKTHLMAVLSRRSFAIVSLTPTLSTYKINDLPAWNSSFGYISWNKSNDDQVAFSTDCDIRLVDIRKTGFIWSYQASEAICKLTWLTESTLAVLTVSSKLLLLDISVTEKYVDPLVTVIDLLVHDLMVPHSELHFATLDNKIIILTNYCLKSGKINTWSDIVLHHIHSGDYISALGTLGFCLQAPNLISIFELLKLEKDFVKRKQQIEPSFNNLTLATVRFLLKQEDIPYGQLMRLTSLILDLGIMFSNDKMYSILEQVGEVLMVQHNEDFQEIIYQKVSDGTITYLSPILSKAVMEYSVSLKNSRRLETILLSLDPSTLDLDYAFNLCKKFHLYDTLLFLWTNTLGDYISPLIDIILYFAGKSEYCVVIDNNAEPNTLFQYLKHVLLGKIYPTETLISTERILDIKNQFYNIIFHGSSLEWPAKSGLKLLTSENSSDEPAFPYATLLLQSDAKSFLKVLDYAFEDICFNDTPENGFNFTRQYLVDVLLDISHNCKNRDLKLQISLFVCRSIPKYSQFIRMSNTSMDLLVDIICSSDLTGFTDEAQNSLEALFSFYVPKDIEILIEKLKQKNVNRVLLLLYKKARRYANYLELILQKKETCLPEDTILESLLMCDKETSNSPLARAQIVALLRNYFRTIIKNTTNLAKTVDTINHFDPDLHQAAFSLTDTSLMRDYLKCLFSGNTSLSSNFLKQAKPKYLTLLYEYNDTKSIEEWIRSIDLNSVDTGTTLKIIDEHQDFKMSVKFLIKLQDYDLALDKINQIISQLLRQDDPLLLNEFLDLGVQVSQKSEGTNQNWIKLISNLISQYSSLDNKGKVACDGCLQTLFIRLSELDISKSDEREDSFFWSTIMKIFENQTLILSKIIDLKTVLENIFMAYYIEETLKILILKLTNNSASSEILLYVELTKQGWPIKSHECDVCGKKVWGIGIDNTLFNDWESIKLTGISDTTKNYLIIFKCGHCFHSNCLENMGQQEKHYKCLTCLNDIVR